MSERDRRILDAIARGTQTSLELARLFGSTRARMSVMLHRLAALDLIERGGAPGSASAGRPCIRWRILARAAAA